VITIIAMLVGILLPALSHAKVTANISRDITNVKNAVSASVDYTMDNKGVMMSDDREPGLVQSSNTLKPNSVASGEVLQGKAGTMGGPQDPDVVQLMKTWLGKLEPRLGSFQNPEVMDCPLIDDAIRKYGSYTLPNGEVRKNYWYSDYSLNRFGLNVPISIAEQPSKNVMFAEGFQINYTFSTLNNVVIGTGYGPRPDLEEQSTGSLSFGFVDGHASRVRIPAFPGGQVYVFATFHELALSAGSPPYAIQFGATNSFLWAERQVNAQRRFKAPSPANNYTIGTLPPNPDPKDRGKPL